MVVVGDGASPQPTRLRRGLSRQHTERGFATSATLPRGRLGASLASCQVPYASVRGLAGGGRPLRSGLTATARSACARVARLFVTRALSASGKMTFSRQTASTNPARLPTPAVSPCGWGGGQQQQQQRRKHNGEEVQALGGRLCGDPSHQD